MSFPLTPDNGEVYIKDGIRYVYASSDNSWTIQADPDKIAGNIKNGVEIDGITGTFPDDGDAAVGDVLAGKTFYSNDATKKTGTLSTGLGSLYITSLDMPLSYGYKDGTHTLQNTYAFVSGNYIYCPIGMYMSEDSSNVRLYLYVLILDTTSSNFPARTGITIDYQNVTLISTYLNYGVLYFNLSNSYYYNYTIATNAWSAAISGSYTTGTQLTTALTLNGFKYEPSIAYGDDPNDTVNNENGLFYPVCKITKV